MPDCKDFFSYNTCSRNISGVCRFVGLTVKISKQDFIILFNLVGNFFCRKKECPYIRSETSKSFFLLGSEIY